MNLRSEDKSSSPGPIYAVLTGDLVGSTELTPEERRRLPSLLRGAVDRARIGFPEAVHGEIDIFRGDSWQLVLSDPVQALRIGLFLRAVIRSAPGEHPLDSRLAVGYGPVDYLPEQDISTGNGPAFYLSGSGLESAWKNCRMVLNFPDAVESRLTRALNIIVRLIDLQVNHWTPKQAEAVSGALIELTQKQIGRGWVREQVSQQAISQHLEGAGWVKIKSSLEFTEEILPELIQEMHGIQVKHPLPEQLPPAG